MARPLRIEYPGATYHVTSCGNERRPIVRDDRDREKLLEILADVVHRFGWHVYAWVLMTNHYHLFVMTPEPNLARRCRSEVTTTPDIRGLHRRIVKDLYLEPGAPLFRSDPPGEAAPDAPV